MVGNFGEARTGMANIYRRGQAWWGRFTKDGQEHRRSLETRSESVARERLAAWTRQVEAERWGAKPRLSLNEVMHRFITMHGPTLRPATLSRYGISIGWLNAEMGDRLLLEIKPSDLKDFETVRRTAGAAAPTVRRDLGCLSSIFGFAIEEGWADANPVPAFLKQRRKRGLRESVPRTRYLSRAEEARLCEGALPYVRDAILFAIYSGLRLEEQFSLTWPQVDLVRRQVVVTADTAKSHRERTVILLEPALEVLRRMPRHVSSPYIFHHGAATTQGRGARRVSSVDGGPPRSSNDGDRFNHLGRGLAKASERGRVARLRWHDLRRTHGCRLLQEEGWTLEMVRDQLGHRSVVQTERAYAFLEVEDRRSWAGRTNPGTARDARSAWRDATIPDIDPATGEEIVAHKPAQGRRSDLEKRAKSKR